MSTNGFQNPFLAALAAFANGGDEAESRDSSVEDDAGGRAFNGYSHPAVRRPKAASKGCVCPGRSALPNVRRTPKR